MFLDKYTLQLMLRSYRDSLADEMSNLLDKDSNNYVDIIESDTELIKSINRVLEGREKLVIESDLNFKE